MTDGIGEPSHVKFGSDIARIRSAELGSDALLHRLVSVFHRHAKRTGKSFEDCRLLLMNGVMP